MTWARTTARVALWLGVILVMGTAGVWVFWRPGPHVAMDPTTIPAGDSAVVLITGDTGAGKEGQHAVAALMEERCVAHGGVAAILIAGDLVYDNGVTSVDDPQWESKGIGPYRAPCLSKAPIVAALGNHDYNGRAAAVIEKSRVEPRWIIPARNHEVRLGDLVQVVVIDSNRPDICGAPGTCMWDFVWDRLSKPFSGWRWVMAHHFLDGSGAHHPSAGFFGVFGKWALCGRVNAYLAGHSHHLEHLRFDECAMDHWISGGGGGPLQGLRETRAAASLWAQRAHGVLEAMVERDRVRWTFYVPGEGAVYSSETRRETVARTGE